MIYFKAKDDVLFIPEDKIVKLFRSRKTKEWYVTMPDWTNIKIESANGAPVVISKPGVLPNA